MLTLRKLWTRQPQSFAQFAPNFASAIGFACNPGLLARLDLKSQLLGSDTGTISPTVSAAGMSAVASSTSNTRRAWSTITPVPNWDNGYAILVVANPSSTAAQQRAFVLGDESSSGNTASTLFFNATGNGSASAGRAALVEYSSGYKSTAETGTDACDGKWHVYVANRPQGGSNGIVLYVDGVNKTSAVSPFVGVAASAGIWLHGSTASTSQGYPNGIALAVLFKRQLSAGEVGQLSINPWRVFAARPIYIPTSTAAAPTVPTLSLPTATNITTTGARLGLTLTF